MQRTSQVRRSGINIRIVVLRILLKLGFLVTRSIPKAQLLELLKKLGPVSTQFDLIRIGGSGDGGYLIPDDLDGIKTCFSPGVSDTANFELELAQRGIDCFMADYSVEKSPIDHPRFDFQRKFIGSTSNDIFITLEDWVLDKDTRGSESILQMDIEGGEYSAILATPQYVLSKFRIIVIEFHGLNDLLNPRVFPYISATFEKLLQDFKVVHIHPNNASNPVVFHGINLWPTMEFTFLRNDRIGTLTSRSDFPHRLDVDNATNKPSSILSKEWFTSEFEK